MLEERARDLGRLIGQSGEYQAVKRANDALSEDAEAMKLLQKLDGLRGKAQQMMARGEQPTEEMERELESLLQNVQTNPSYQRVLVAQENFDKVMGRVNEWILDGIKKGAASPIITLG
jgi:cell fate (sporulation/competence/biofilm development) regulator YlbF (YheA/YmcA/DUF963 family)